MKFDEPTSACAPTTSSFGVRDVRLRVELVLRVDAALDLAGLQSASTIASTPFKERIAILLGFEARDRARSRHALFTPSSDRRLRARGRPRRP